MLSLVEGGGRSLSQQQYLQEVHNQVLCLCRGQETSKEIAVHSWLPQSLQAACSFWVALFHQELHSA